MQPKKLRSLNFSDRFVDLCTNSGKTQKELAAMLQASEGSLINWKRGRTPKSDELYRIAKIFGVSMEWLLTGEDDNELNGHSAWQQRAMTAEQKLDALKSGLQAFLKKF